MNRPEHIPAVRHSDKPAPEHVIAACPKTGDTAWLYDPRTRPVTATTGAWGKYVDYFYLCSECAHRHNFNYETETVAAEPDWG